MTRNRSTARRHHLTHKQRRAKRATRPAEPTPEEIEAIETRLMAKFDRIAKTLQEQRHHEAQRSDHKLALNWPDQLPDLPYGLTTAEAVDPDSPAAIS